MTLLKVALQTRPYGKAEVTRSASTGCAWLVETRGVAVHDAVRDTWIAFNEPFEGRVRWMYLDVRGLVTVGIGNLIDPVGEALARPFVHDADGTPASTDEIRTAWEDLKGRPELASRGHRACEELNDLRLRDDAIDELVMAKLSANEEVIAGRFPDFAAWPADAQLGTLSMAWALGPHFTSRWPRFTSAATSGDWSTAAAECRIDETGNPGVAPRNRADLQLFENAAVVARGDLDVAALWWPSTPAG